MARQRNPSHSLKLRHKLVLNQWLFSLFGLSSTDGTCEVGSNRVPLLEAFKQRFQISEDTAEGMDENNVHRFFHALTNQSEELPELPNDLLLEYDQNIVRHTQRLNEGRITRGEEPIAWKYFQYLTLLFTEIYLHRYFRDPEALRRELNEQIDRFNETVGKGDRLEPLDETQDAWPQLNKVALWSATGSGKTLLMHANVLQYRHYLEKHGRRRDLNRVILVTPNENLSRQHLEEFTAAGIQAELFDKDGRGLFAGQAVEIIDIHKLRDEMGDKTVAVDAFENNNLVLIDEGHRGASSGETGAWMRFRNALSERGFSFEYSATFEQAVKGSKPLTEQYARSILFDYSYRYFYGDGFGKDYQILNLDEATEQNHLDLYLTACVLGHVQQLRLFEESRGAFVPFHIEKPLLVFVGGSVTKGHSKREASDVIEILRFLARYVDDRRASVQRIDEVLNQGLVAADGRNLFAGRFPYLNTTGLSADEIFEDSLRRLFNAPGGGKLYVENLMGATGEVALRIGASEDAFGVINVGDDAKLVELCEKHGLETGEREFTGSLFGDINEPGSGVNVLIGARKFTEGWNSWRVSTMGLMNVGRKEGAQIIQLFGRGVRLKGYDRTLRRSSNLTLPEGVTRPKHLGLLETLNVFGIAANYMAQFREFLEEEGLPPNKERIEFFLPVLRNLGTTPLRTIRIKRKIGGVRTEADDAFQKLGQLPTLDVPTDYLRKNRVTLNWYPKISALRSRDAESAGDEAQPNEGHLTERHVAFLDLDRLYFELERYKDERGWHNLNLSKDALTALLTDPDWYTLQIPEDALAFGSFDRVELWQEIAGALLKKYTERYYFFSKREWELPHLEYRILDEGDPNFLAHDSGYRIKVDASEEEIIETLTVLRDAINDGQLKDVDFRGLKTIWFDRHLYQPLLHLERGTVEVSPVPLNRGEETLVKDLRRYCDDNEGFLEDKELYLLRNLSRGRGVGFFEAGNFHPDFILWLVVDGHQYVTFIDPKGIRQLSLNDPKINFHRTIKELEARLGDPHVTLNSFIVSSTGKQTMLQHWNVTEAELAERHVLFQEDRYSYVETIISELMEIPGAV